MNVVAYDKSKIVRLTRDCLEYLAHDGSERLVDFEVCRKNFNGKYGKLGECGTRYVGFRDFGADPPHITLFSDPPTRFEFSAPKKQVVVPGPKFLQRGSLDQRDFLEFKMQLHQAGWVTGDIA